MTSRHFTAHLTALPHTPKYTEESVERQCFLGRFSILEDAILQYSWLKVRIRMSYVHIKLAKTSAWREIIYLQQSHSWNLNIIGQVESRALC